MIALLTTLVLAAGMLFAPAATPVESEPVVLTGPLSRYAYWPWIATAQWYIENDPRIDESVWQYDVMLATESCDLIGWTGTMRMDDDSEYSAIVFDCAGKDAYDEDGLSWMARNGIVAETDYAWWKEHPQYVQLQDPNGPYPQYSKQVAMATITLYPQGE